MFTTIFSKCAKPVLQLAGQLRSSRKSVRTVVKLAGRPWLPGSDSPSFPKEMPLFDESYPHQVKVDVEKKDLISFAKKFRPTLDEEIRKHGAVVIQGLPLDNAADFSEFYDGMEYHPIPYTGGTGGRENLLKNVFTSSSDPEEYTLEQHNEMSYLPFWPHLLFIYCEVETQQGCGGENGLTDVRVLFDSIDPEITAKFNRLGVRYWRYLPRPSHSKYKAYIAWHKGTTLHNGDLPPNTRFLYVECAIDIDGDGFLFSSNSGLHDNHQKTLETDDMKELESRVTGAGCSFKRDEEGGLCFWMNRPAMSPHFRTGEMLWFGQVCCYNWTFLKDCYPDHSEHFVGVPEEKFPFTTMYGDGTLIEPEVIRHIREKTWECTKGGQLKRKEVLVFDNMLFSHSRLSFSGQRVNRVSQACYKEYLAEGVW